MRESQVGGGVGEKWVSGRHKKVVRKHERRSLLSLVQVAPEMLLQHQGVRKLSTADEAFVQLSLESLSSVDAHVRF